MSRMRLLIVMVLMLLVVMMPAEAQVIEPTPEAGRAGTVFVDPVIGEHNVPDEAVPYNEMLDDIALMMTALVDDIGDMVIPAQAQVIDDAPPVVVDDDGRYQLILLTFGAVFVIFAGTIAYFGKLLFDSIPPALQDTMEYTLKRVAEGAIDRTEKTPATWDDALAQSFYDQVQAWFDDWRKVNPTVDDGSADGNTEKN